MFASYFTGEEVYRRFVKHNYVLSFIAIEYEFTLFFFTVNSSVNVVRIILSA